MEKRRYILLTALSIMLLALTTVSCLYIGKYLHPIADDYAYGADAHLAWLNTHSISACMKAAWNTMTTTYNTWQGTYTGIFLMSLQPGVFGYYWITPVLLTGSLIVSTYLLMYMIMIKLLYATRLEYVFVSSVFVLINMLFVYSAYDAFYWYNGGMYYILFYSLSLLLASLLIAYCHSDSRVKKTAIATAALLDCIILGGGNFISGFATAVVMLAVIIIYTIEKKRIPIFCTISLVVFTIAFAVSVFAPGNAFREADQRLSNPSFTPSVSYGIVTSLFRSSTFTLKAMAGFMPFAFTAILPMVAKIAIRSGFKFSNPWLCIAVTYLLYVAVFFPHCYATNYVGPNRVRNIYIFSLFWLILVNMFYLSGAVAKRQGYIGSAGWRLYTAIMGFANNHKWIKSNCGTIIAAILILSTFAPNSTVLRNIAMLDGTIQKSDKEMNERESLLESSNEDTVFVKPLTVALPSDAYADAKSIPGDWVNDAIAKYYGKKNVYAAPQK